MTEVVLPLITLFGLFGAVLAFIGVLGVRRSVLTRHVGTFDCSIRRDDRHRQGNWTLGIARYEADRLDWFRAFTMSPRPSHSMARNRLTILERQDRDGTEGHTVQPGWVIVRCAYGALTLDLAMSEDDYGGLATWLESAPPGAPAQVA